MEKNLPEEYQLVLTKSPDGTPLIAYRNATRWYGFLYPSWLEFEPVDFTPMDQLARQSAIIAAQAEVIEAARDMMHLCAMYNKSGVIGKGAEDLSSALQQLDEVQNAP